MPVTYVGANTRVSLGVDDDLNVVGEILHIFGIRDESAWLVEGWIGAGGEAPVEEAPYAIIEEVTTGEIHEEGKILHSQLVKAKSDKGASKLLLSDAAASLEKEATDEIDTDRIPRSAQKAVREYFGNGEGQE